MAEREIQAIVVRAVKARLIDQSTDRSVKPGNQVQNEVSGMYVEPKLGRTKEGTAVTTHVDIGEEVERSGLDWNRDEESCRVVEPVAPQCRVRNKRAWKGLHARFQRSHRGERGWNNILETHGHEQQQLLTPGCY